MSSKPIPDSTLPLDVVLAHLPGYCGSYLFSRDACSLAYSGPEGSRQYYAYNSLEALLLEFSGLWATAEHAMSSSGVQVRPMNSYCCGIVHLLTIPINRASGPLMNSASYLICIHES